MKAEIKTNNANLEVLQSILVSQMDIHQAQTKAIHEEIIAKRDAHQEWMKASMNAWQKDATACQEAMEACLESNEPNSHEIKSPEQCMRWSLNKKPQ
jgi:hypothetical protein